MRTLPISILNEFEFTKKYFQIGEHKPSYIVDAIASIVNMDRNEYGALDAYVEIDDDKVRAFSFTYINNVEMELFLHILAKYNNKSVDEMKDRIYFDGQTQKQFKIKMTNLEFFCVYLVYEFHRVELKSAYRKYLKQNVVENVDEDDKSVGIGSVNKQRRIAQNEFTFIYLNRTNLREVKENSDKSTIIIL